MNQVATLGRPRLAFDPETAARICELLANGDKPLSELLKAHGELPCWETVSRWRDEFPYFAEELTRAKSAYLERMAEGLIAKADEGIEQPTKVRALKLAIDTRQWLLAKWLPETYGDKLDLTSKGEKLEAPSHTIDARIQSIVLTAQRRQAESVELDPVARSLLE